jgi:predicted Zn-dependent protease
MKSKIIFITLIAVLLTGLDVSHHSIGFMTAQSQEDNSKRKTKKTGSMSEKVAKKLGEAQELIEDEKLDEGVAILNSILELKKISPYERGQVNYFFAYVRYLKGDLKGAITFYKKVAEDPNVPDGLIESSKFTIAQLYFQIEDWPSAITAVDSLLIDQPNRTDLYVLKGSAMYQQKQYKEMIPIINKAISIAEEANAFRLEQRQRNITEVASKYRVKYDRDQVDYISLASQIKIKLKEDLTSIRTSSEKYVEIEDAIKSVEVDAKNLAIGPTKENWWLLLRAAYFELEQMDNVKTVLQRLVIEWSKKEYWTQLSAFYGQDKQEKEQMAAYQTAYHEGFLEKSSEFVQMAQLYLSVEAPYEAARILQKAIDEGKVDKEEKNWKLLAQAWFLAQYDEKAVVALREAAKLSDDGELDIRLARSLSNMANFKECIEAAQTAIKKGDLKRLDESYITLGMCQFEEARYDDAKQAFANAKIDADYRNEEALKECAASENLELQELLVTLETQKAFREMNKEIEGKIISCSIPSSLKTVANWQKFLDKEVERVTMLENQKKALIELLASNESQALSF